MAHTTHNIDCFGGNRWNGDGGVRGKEEEEGGG